MHEPSAHCFRLPRCRPDRRELIRGQRLAGKQQVAGSRLLERLRDDVPHRHVDLALGGLGDFDPLAEQVDIGSLPILNLCSGPSSEPMHGRLQR